MRRFVLLAVLAAAMLLPAPAPAAELPPGGTFSDDDGHVLEGYVEAVTSAGILGGCAPHRFCPGDSVDDATARFLSRAVGSPVGSGPVPAPSLTRAGLARSLARSLGLRPTSPPPFLGTVEQIGEAVRARMAHSWSPGCPVPLEDLRYVRVHHWGFDGEVHEGELVVHRDHAGPIVEVMRTLFAHRFPIERMELVDEYGGDDRASMAANNTSAFNCRPVEGRPGVWSQHAYGWAIDINPVQNPYVSRRAVLPEAGRAHLDRSLDAPGLIRPGEEVVTAFAGIGWGWGGHWSSLQDYQHFSATGR